MRLFISVLVIFSIGFGFSQTEVAPPPNVEIPPADLSVPTDSVIVFGGTPEASFPGGFVGLKQYITEHFPLDSIPEENRENGRVYVQFVVCYTGEIEDVQIARGLNMETDAVCLEFIKNMPNWIPAQDVKRPVDTRVRLPITFNLN